MIRYALTRYVGLLGLLCAATASAQTSFEPRVPSLNTAPRSEPAVPHGLPEQRVEPIGEIAPPPAVVPRPVLNQRLASDDRDARHCLTATANQVIHRCAERYRSGGSGGSTARVRRTSTRVTAPPPAPARETAAPAPETMKPAAPRAGDAAKAAEIVKPMDVTRTK